MSVKHGRSHEQVYKVWFAMKDRCRNPRNYQWKNYGGRGISYDPRWEKFENFIADMGERPRGLTLERIDNNKGYCKANCKWATPKEQSANRRICGSYEGKPYAYWSAKLGVSLNSIRQKMHRYGTPYGSAR
jgi:hypothetical protein